MDYLEWNFLLASHFFKKEMAGREVILFADSSTIEKIGARDNVDLDDFIKAIKEGPEITSHLEEVCEKAHYLFKFWRNTNRTYPLYIAYLVFFVLGAGAEGDFANHAYYPRLNSLLGKKPDSGAPYKFYDMHKLWSDLEQWSKEDRKEELGRFTARVWGNWKHIGLPLSQTILTEKEQKLLPQFFAENNFDPTCPPSNNVIINAMVNSNLFNPKTIKVLNDNNNQMLHLKTALIEMVCDELREWDGLVLTEHQDIDNSLSIHHAQLRICFTYDSLAQVVKATARFKCNHLFPEEDMEFVRKNDGTVWVVRELKSRWSTALESKVSKIANNASELNWADGETFIDYFNGWNLRLRPAKVRAFVLGKKEDLPGWVEVSQIEGNTEYFIACHNEVYKSIIDWGTKHCSDFRHLPANGLPAGWYLFRTSSIIQSHNDFDLLKLPTTLFLHINGGIKSGCGNSYFDFAPPELLVEGAKGNESILMNGQEIDGGEGGKWIIPSNAPSNVPLKFELVSNGDVVRRRTIILEDIHMLSNYSPPLRDKFGKIVPTKSIDITIGGSVVNVPNISDIPDYQDDLPTYLANKIIFIGRRPGQIMCWPNDYIKLDWAPVWAIVKLGRDQWKSYFVGSSIELDIPENTGKGKHGWKKWKQFLCKSNVESLKIRQVVELWRKYKKEAKKL